MRFRRGRGRSFASRGKGTREQVSWFRQDLSVSNVGPFASILSAVLFDPDTIHFNIVDERWTVRAIRLSWTFVQTVTVAGSLPAVKVCYGIQMRGRQEPPASPALLALTDQQADWLDLGEVLETAVVGTVIDGPANDSGYGSPFRREVRSQRKIDSDQVLSFDVAPKVVAPTLDTAPTVTRQTIEVHSSVLFQRTRR